MSVDFLEIVRNSFMCVPPHLVGTAHARSLAVFATWRASSLQIAQTASLPRSSRLMSSGASAKRARRGQALASITRSSRRRAILHAELASSHYTHRRRSSRIAVGTLSTSASTRATTATSGFRETLVASRSYAMGAPRTWATYSMASRKLRRTSATESIRSASSTSKMLFLRVSLRCRSSCRRSSWRSKLPVAAR